MHEHERHGAHTTNPTPGTRRADTTTGRVRALQRRIGNAAMAGLMAGEHGPPTPGALVEDSVSGPGRVLPPAIQRVATRAGLNTAGVRTHEGPAVETAARSIHALAFTTSRPGKRPAIAITQRVRKDPALLRKTLLEETFHSHQQNRGRVDGTPYQDTMMSRPNDRHEREAQGWAEQHA